MDAYTLGIKLIHLNHIATHCTIDLFVDNTNSGLIQDALSTFQPQPTSPVPKHNIVYDQTAANVQFYSDLLSSSGGKLTLHKSYIYVLKTIWRQGHCQLNEIQCYLPALKITQQAHQKDFNLLSPKKPAKCSGF